MTFSTLVSGWFLPDQTEKIVGHCSKVKDQIMLLIKLNLCTIPKDIVGKLATMEQKLYTGQGFVKEV